MVRLFDLALRAPDALPLAIAWRLDLAVVMLGRRMAAAGRERGVDVVELKTD
jgi:hypothetical protein